MSYYDRQGNPITPEEYYDLQRDPEYRTLRVEELENGLEISTIWLGSNHNYSRTGPPFIFETMIFGGKHNLNMPLECRRYATEEEAFEGHEKLKTKWENGATKSLLNSCAETLEMVEKLEDAIRNLRGKIENLPYACAEAEELKAKWEAT